MKRIKIISVILGSVLVFSLWTMWFTQKKTSAITLLLTQAITEVNLNAYPNAIALANNAQAEWEKSGEIILLVVRNCDIDTISEHFLRLQVTLAHQDKMESLLLIEQICFRLHHIYHDEIPLLKNIF